MVVEGRRGGMGCRKGLYTGIVKALKALLAMLRGSGMSVSM